MRRTLIVILMSMVFVSCVLCAGCGSAGGYKEWSSGREKGAVAETKKYADYKPEEPTASVFTVANYFSDNMILPRDKAIVIWGTAPESENGKIVAAEFKGLKGSAKIENGEWSMNLMGTLPASSEKGQTLTVYGAGGVKKEFEDVLVGDIWVIGGQSNAELSFFGTFSDTTKDIAELYKEELENAVSEDNIRILRQTSYDLIKDQYNDALKEPQNDIFKAYRWTDARRSKIKTGSVETSFTMLGYFFGKELVTINPEVPVGIISASCGAATLSALASKEANDAFPESMKNQSFIYGTSRINACGVYNAFMAPLLNVSITGMVFFQGESDSINSDDYGEALIAYVNDLREKFGSNFMFINMQLTSYGYESGGVQLTGIWDCVPDMRYAQSELKMDGSISNYEVITTLDAGWRDGDGDGAHPYYKKVIAQRAAALAAAKIYNIGDINSSGCPVPSKIEYNRKEIVITYDYYGSSLQTQGGGDVTGFEVKQGGEWKAVDKAVIDGNKITISGLDNPEGVRYAPELRYTSTDNANVCSSSGYPAAAFSAEFA